VSKHKMELYTKRQFSARVVQKVELTITLV